MVSRGACSDTSACFDVASIGEAEHGFGKSVTLYPNPTSGQFTLDLGGVMQDVQVRIFTSDGRVVLTKSYKSAKLLNLQLNAAPGSYIVEISTGAGEKAAFNLAKTQ